MFENYCLRENTGPKISGLASSHIRWGGKIQKWETELYHFILEVIDFECLPMLISPCKKKTRTSDKGLRQDPSPNVNYREILCVWKTSQNCMCPPVAWSRIVHFTSLNASSSHACINQASATIRTFLDSLLRVKPDLASVHPLTCPILSNRDSVFILT